MRIALSIFGTNLIEIYLVLIKSTELARMVAVTPATTALKIKD